MPRNAPEVRNEGQGSDASEKVRKALGTADRVTRAMLCSLLLAALLYALCVAALSGQLRLEVVTPKECSSTK
jgi:amino acid transporter